MKYPTSKFICITVDLCSNKSHTLFILWAPCQNSPACSVTYHVIYHFPTQRVHRHEGALQLHPFTSSTNLSNYMRSDLLNLFHLKWDLVNSFPWLLSAQSMWTKLLTYTKFLIDFQVRSEFLKILPFWNEFNLVMIHHFRKSIHSMLHVCA